MSYNTYIIFFGTEKIEKEKNRPTDSERRLRHAGKEIRREK
jgi:hypothetical protein